MRNSLSILVILAVLFTISTAHAIPITHEFSANILGIIDADGLLIGTGVTPSSTLIGSLSYDTSSRPVAGRAPLVQYLGSGLSMSLDDTYVFSSGSPLVNIRDDRPTIGDQIQTFDFHATVPGGLGLVAGQISFFLRGFTGTAFADTSLSNPLDLRGFDLRSAEIVGFGPGQKRFVVSSQITSLKTTAVPEPATILLVGSGLMGLVALRMRIRKR